jgi:hypothetical protein
VNVQVHHVIVHNSEQVAGILAEALRITTETELDDELRPIAFEQACQLLAQRFSVAIPQEQVNVPLMAIPRGNGR